MAASFSFSPVSVQLLVLVSGLLVRANAEMGTYRAYQRLETRYLSKGYWDAVCHYGLRRYDTSYRTTRCCHFLPKITAV